ncbi:MAG: TolC family protein [Candidatus Omnitrophica bacterium]|nr:TolC family protein [Candidatus Omnitrophota bacterium]
MKKFLILSLIFINITFCEEILTLTDCVKIAIENNLKLKIYRDKIEQNYYQTEISRKYLYPSLSVSFNYTYLGDYEGITFGNFPPFKILDDNTYTLKFTISQPLFTGWEIEKGFEISKEYYEKSKIDYENEFSNIIMDVKNAYFNVLKAKKILQTSFKYKENLEKHLINAKRMFELGMATKLDILKTEVALKNAETKIIESESYLKKAKANLNFILNRSIENEFEVEDILEEKEEKKDYNWWKENALKERKEIKSFAKVISIYEKNIEIERSNLYPQIYFFFNYNIEKGTQTSRYSWGDNWNTGILLTYDIWNWRQTEDRIKKAEKEKERLEKEFELLKDSIEMEVKNIYLNLKSLEEKVKEIEKQIEFAEENLRVAELLYNEGLATSLDVIEAITSLTETKNNYLNALYEYKITYIQLEKASGILKMEGK